MSYSGFNLYQVCLFRLLANTDTNSWNSYNNLQKGMLKERKAHKWLLLLPYDNSYVVIVNNNIVKAKLQLKILKNQSKISVA